MTIPTMAGLNTALSGLEAAQAAIDTTGENISNANTPGYSRQVVNQVESPEFSIPTNSLGGSSGQVGTGVSLQSISRIRDQFLDVQYRQQNTSTSNANTTTSQLEQAQTAVNEPSTDGIGTQLSNFWTAWQTLAANPSGSANAAALNSVVDAGQTLASTFNAVSAQLSTVSSQAAAQYTSLTGTLASNGQDGAVEQDATQIAALNQQIAAAQQSGTQPNALLDQRDTVIDNLSSLATVSLTNNSDGTVTVGFGDAASPLVSGGTVNWPQTLTSAAGGQLGALLTLSSPTSGPITSLQTSLDAVAKNVIDSVNALQPSSPFFSGSTASTITVVATTSTVQSSSTNTSGSDLATSISAIGKSAGSPDSEYASFVGKVGDTVSAAQSSQATSQSILTAVSNQRDSVSGVSLDEEMSNLIKYQQAYQASARMMNTMDTVINDLLTSIQ